MHWHPGWVFFRQPSRRTHWLHNCLPSSPPTTLKPGGWNFPRTTKSRQRSDAPKCCSPFKKQKNSELKWWRSLKVGKKKQRKAMVVFLRMIRLGWKIPDPNTARIEPNCLIQTNFQGNPETYGRPLASLSEETRLIKFKTCISNLYIKPLFNLYIKPFKHFLDLNKIGQRLGFHQIPHGFGVPLLTSGHSHALIAAP